jgi:hypothetical protein
MVGLMVDYPTVISVLKTCLISLMIKDNFDLSLDWNNVQNFFI